MGASLSSRFEWIQLPNEPHQTLSTSVQNQELLYELVSIISQICQKYANEAKAEFKKPLIFTSTSLVPSQIASSANNQFNIQYANAK